MSSLKSVAMLAYRVIVDIWNHPANANRKIRSLSQAVVWQAQKRFLKSDKLINFHGMLLFCPADNHSASRAIYFYQYPDYGEMKFIEKLLRNGDQFIDVGANIGLYSLLALSCIGTDGRVHSMEPNPTLFNLLQKTKRTNELENWSIHQVAIGEYNDRTTLTNTGDDCTNHIASGEEIVGSTQVEIVALQDYFSTESFTMIKLDIEGYEPFAIRGMRKWLLLGKPPVILLEIAGYSKRYGITSDELISEIEELGYFLAVYCPDTNKLVKTNRPWDIPVDNILAIHAQSEAWVLDRISGKSTSNTI